MSAIYCLSLGNTRANPFPPFRKNLSICERAHLGKHVSVHLYCERLVPADETGGNFVAGKVHVFSVRASAQNISPAGCIKRLPRLCVVSSKDEVSIRKYLYIPCSFRERLAGDQLPGSIQLALHCEVLFICKAENVPVAVWLLFVRLGSNPCWGQLFL